jgi:hypothetical protein
MNSTVLSHDEIITFKPNQLFTITTEGLVSNVDYMKEAKFVLELLSKIPGEWISCSWLEGGDEKTTMDILLIYTTRGLFSFPNIERESQQILEDRWMMALGFKVEGGSDIVTGDDRETHELDPSIVRIGCNYGEYISTEYHKFRNPVRKSKRGRKRNAVPSVVKNGIGLRRYFNSQITFTTIVDELATQGVVPISKEVHLYHIKLYTNGKIQIPNVKSENIEIAKPVVQRVINYVNEFPKGKANKPNMLALLDGKEAPTSEFVSIRSIMRNYKFRVEQFNVYIAISKFIPLLEHCKNYFDEDARHSGYFDNPKNCKYLELFEQHREVLSKHRMIMYKYQPEKYVGLIIKFDTPSEEFPKRVTTVMMFHSTNINIDGCNLKSQAESIRNIITMLIQIAKVDVLYKKILDDSD